MIMEQVADRTLSPPTSPLLPILEPRPRRSYYHFITILESADDSALPLPCASPPHWTVGGKTVQALIARSRELRWESEWYLYAEMLTKDPQSGAAPPWPPFKATPAFWTTPCKEAGSATAYAREEDIQAMLIDVPHAPATSTDSGDGGIHGEISDSRDEAMSMLSPEEGSPASEAPPTPPWVAADDDTQLSQILDMILGPSLEPAQEPLEADEPSWPSGTGEQYGVESAGDPALDALLAYMDLG